MPPDVVVERRIYDRDHRQDWYNRDVQFPEKIPGLRLLTIIAAGYAVIWIALEGNMLRVTLLAVIITLAVFGRVAQRFLAGRTLSLPAWLTTWAGFGLLFGISANLMTIIFMALKSGLHAHGPEFTPEQIERVVQRAPFWMISGLLVGLGVGLLLAGLGRPGRRMIGDGIGDPDEKP